MTDEAESHSASITDSRGISLHSSTTPVQFADVPTAISDQSQFGRESVACFSEFASANNCEF
jgi:hypothetical protein